MTLEEIRREKKVAQEAVQEILSQLAKRTGLSPEAVEFSVIDVTTFGGSRQIAIGMVEIRMESV